MTPIDIVILVAVVGVVGGAVSYIVLSRKKGKKCIGCPYAGTCGKSNCSCQTGESPNDQGE